MNERLAEKLGQAAALRDLHTPEILRLAVPADHRRWEELLETPGVQVHDQLEGQLRDLLKARSPLHPLSNEELDKAVHARLNGKPAATHGVWVHYPWSGRLVHLLDEEEFIEVRTDRNRNKITREEQARLTGKRVGIIGLSVGQSVALTMALERTAGELRLADFDRIELTNLNRIRSGAHAIGMNKAVNVAREIAEIDPFLKVTCFTEGLTRENMDAFFDGDGGLDLVIEECDSIDIKILARKAAKARGIPVVMDMSDRGCLDIERFDLEPDRPLMHGWIDHLDLDAAANALTSEEKVPYMLPIVGVETLSPRLKASVVEVGRTLSTWPQLATSVVLGGALAGDAVRRILLGHMTGSGRWFVDLDELVGTPVEVPPPDATPPAPTDANELADATEASDLPLGAPPDTGLVSEELAVRCFEAGALAPSAGNMQPWRFLQRGDRLYVLHDEAASASIWDPDHLIAHIALGTAVENIVLRIQENGLSARVHLAPIPDRPELVAAIDVLPVGSPDVEPEADRSLAAGIAVRCTNRKLLERDPSIPGRLKDALALASAMPGCSAHLLTDPDALAELASICGTSERIRVVNPIGHREFFQQELRWTPEEVERTRDGLDIDTLEMSLNDVAGLRIASDPRAMALVDAWGGGSAFERFSTRAVRAASAVVLVAVDDDRTTSRLMGGRAAERFWTAANLAGVSVHPISAPIFLIHAARLGGPGIRPAEREDLLGLEARFMALWPDLVGRPLFMMRISPGGEPTARALRKPLQELVLRPQRTLH